MIMGILIFSYNCIVITQKQNYKNYNAGNHSFLCLTTFSISEQFDNIFFFLYIFMENFHVQRINLIYLFFRGKHLVAIQVLILPYKDPNMPTWRPQAAEKIKQLLSSPSTNLKVSVYYTYTFRRFSD